MSIFQIINLAMFALVGVVMAYLDAGIVQRPIPFLIVMVAMAIVNITARMQ